MWSKKCKIWRLETLLDLGHIKITICNNPSEFSNAVIELHHFSGASERAYGCCASVRCIKQQGKIHTCTALVRLARIM